MNNTNLLEAMNGALSLEGDTGSVRETFFVNQIGFHHAIHTHEKADFLIDNKYVVEVGRKNKNQKQIKSLPDAYLALDGIKVGIGKQIPLYLFGFLY